MFTRNLLALVLTAPLAAAQVTVYEHRGPTDHDHTGWAVSPAGDVNADGWPDVAIGSPTWDTGGWNVGRVEVISGRDGSVLLSIEGPGIGNQFGMAVDALGDINGDGRGDLIIGSPNANNQSGLVRIYSGTGQLLLSLSVGGVSSLSGSSVTGLGDIDGDGIGDFAFGTSGFDGVAFNCGRFDVYSGATLQLMYWVEGTEAGEYLGASIDAAGDVDGDGRSEIVVGAPGKDHPLSSQADVGRVSVWSSTPGGGVLLFSRVGASPGDGLGHSVAGLGDVDGDGLSDIAAGAPTASVNGAQSGHVEVISGQAPHPVFWSQEGQSFYRLGDAVAGLGDMDGDGLGELGVGTPGLSVLPGDHVGRIQAIAPLSGQVLHSWYGSTPEERLGRSLSTAGDLNLDGYADAVLGAPSFGSQGLLNMGRVLVVLGQAPLPSSYCTAKVNSAGCTPQITSSGAPSVSIGGDFTIGASSILNSVPGLMIWSRTSAAVPFGGGVLCLGVPIFREGAQFSGSTLGTACGGSFQFNLSHDFFALHNLTAGTTMYTQWWSRDNGFTAPSNMNLTGGLAVTLVP